MSNVQVFSQVSIMLRIAIFITGKTLISAAFAETANTRPPPLVSIVVQQGAGDGGRGSINPNEYTLAGAHRRTASTLAL